MKSRVKPIETSPWLCVISEPDASELVNRISLRCIYIIPDNVKPIETSPWLCVISEPDASELVNRISLRCIYIIPDNVLTTYPFLRHYFSLIRF